MDVHIPGNNTMEHSVVHSANKHPLRKQSVFARALFLSVFVELVMFALCLFTAIFTGTDSRSTGTVASITHWVGLAADDAVCRLAGENFIYYVTLRFLVLLLSQILFFFGLSLLALVVIRKYRTKNVASS
jgi:hypothetical protein